MHTLARTLLPSALAASLIVGYEVLRTALIGDTQLGGQFMGFSASVFGVLGLPLFLLGIASLFSLSALNIAWRWGRADEPSISPARAVAWVLFGALALFVLVFGVQAATERFVRAFRQPVYQGLGAGFVAAALGSLFLWSRTSSV